MASEETLDGCALDFTESPVDDDEVEGMLVPEGDEEDEVDAEGEPLSPGSPDQGLATRLRRAANILGGDSPLFKVREVDGWKRRGRDFAGASATLNVKGSVNHHTAGAGPEAGNAPSLGIVVNGRADLSGPLAQVLQAYDDTAIVVAAGVANHAGSGSWKGLEGNSSVEGLEVEHRGTRSVVKKRVMVMAAIHAVFLWRPSGKDLEPRMTCQHREWGENAHPPTGKPDFATNFSTKPRADTFRDLVKHTLGQLNAVNKWEVSFLAADRERQEQLTGDPDAWVVAHMAAMRRGRVIFNPKRG